MSLASKPDARRAAFESFIERNLAKELLRFTTAGSVDDGKSTLIGRLLHDSKSVFEDQTRGRKKEPHQSLDRRGGFFAAHRRPARRARAGHHD